MPEKINEDTEIPIKWLFIVVGFVITGAVGWGVVFEQIQQVRKDIVPIAQMQLDLVQIKQQLVDKHLSDNKP